LAHSGAVDKQHRHSGQQRSSTLAISLLYQHAVETGDTTAEDKFRNQLQTIAADKNFPGRARDTAIDALSTTKWSSDSSWGQPNYVVRFNLETGREFRVNLEPADDFNPIVFLPSHGKVLLRRAKDQDGLNGKPVGPDRPEYYLLTPDTGETRLVSGEFAPLLQEGNRFLQATGKTDEFWAAIPDEVKDQTQVGRYNLKTFSFSATLTIPHLTFDSMSM